MNESLKICPWRICDSRAKIAYKIMRIDITVEFFEISYVPEVLNVHMNEIYKKLTKIK